MDDLKINDFPLVTGQKNIEVAGPFPELAPAAAKLHEGYWNQ